MNQNLLGKIENREKGTVTYKDFKTLSPRNWLNDEVINKYISFMNEKLCLQCRILHSHFYSVLSKG